MWKDICVPVLATYDAFYKNLKRTAIEIRRSENMVLQPRPSVTTGKAQLFHTV